jgi:TRAP-type C4-dicarboxylate transport system substrate-binding protein
MANSAFFSGTNPFFDVGSIPGIYNHIYQAWEVADDPRVRELFDKNWREFGVTWLSNWTSVQNDGIWAGKGVGVVDTVEKFKGLKARTSGIIQSKTLEALGASPVTIQVAELEQALFRGTIDILTTSLTYGWNRGFTDIVDSVTYWPGVITPGFSLPFIANAEKFDSLPPDLQQALIEATHEVGQEQHFAMNAQLIYVRKAIGLETEIVRASDAEIAKGIEATKGVADEWVAISGPDAPQLLSIVKEIVANYQAFGK